MQHTKEEIKSVFTNVEPGPIMRLTGSQEGLGYVTCLTII